MKLLFRLTILSAAYIIASCATNPTSNPWAYPDRGFTVASVAENESFIASMQLCMEYANDTFPDALRRYKSGLLGGTRLIAMVLDDDNVISWMTVDNAEGSLVLGHISNRHIIKGRFYAAGDKISVNQTDIVDWYIIYRDRPAEGNLLGKHMLRKQDGLALGDCDPTDIEFQSYRYFSMSYSFVPPGTEGWELSGPREDTEMSMQQKHDDLDEFNTLSSSLYRITPNKSDQELIESARNLGRYGDEEGVRYNVVKLEAEIYPHRQARCARSLHIVEDKQALLSKSGKRGFMIRDVQALVCVHPANDGVAVVLIYSHRHHRGKRDPEFINKASKVFESLAFRKKD